MDPDLEVDLAEALDGLDPVELLLGDPLLQTVAEELLDITSGVGSSPDTTLGNSVPVFNVEDFNSSNSEGTTSSPQCSSGSLGSPSSVEAKLEKKCQNKPGANGTAALCVACQKPARGYRYYGVVVCNGCRAFFARSVKDNAYDNFICEQEGEIGQCLANSKSWTSCQKCRFEKCIEVGMIIPKGKRPKKKTNKKPHESEEAIDAVERNIVQKSHKMLQLTNRWSLAEKRAMEAFVSSQFRRGHVDMNNIITSNLDVFEASLENLYHGKCFPLRLNKLYEDYINYSAGRCYVDCEELAFDRLDSRDKARLVQGNFPLVSEFVMACKLNQIANRGEELEAYFKNMLNDTTDPEFNRIYQRITKNGTLKPVTVTYDVIYNRDELGLTELEEVQRHFRTATRLGKVATGDCFDWDPVHCILTIMIMMYSPDFIELDNPREAERLQAMYAYLLQRYMASKNDAGSMRLFRESMLATQYARELRETTNRAWKRLGLVK